MPRRALTSPATFSTGCTETKIKETPDDLSSSGTGVPLTEEKHGLARGLTNYGDADFSLYLRRSFAKSMGYGKEMLARPVVGIAQSQSGFNNCHRHFPELIDA